MIWDLHCHLSGVSGRTPDERMGKLIAFADRMGIERLCVYMGMRWSYDPDPKEMRRQNDEVLQALSHWHDRAFGFVYLNPNHVEESLKELDRCVRDGPMVGVKLWVARRCDDAKLDALIARAVELQAVVFQHTWLKTPPLSAPAECRSGEPSRTSAARLAAPTEAWSRPGGGNLSGESTPQDLVSLAKRHPKAALICGHTGGNCELGIRTVRDQVNVSLDLAGSDPTQGITEMAVREVGSERVIYGSDAGGRSFASQLAKVRGADIPEAAKKQILKDNLKRLLFPILRRKGIKP